MKKLSHIYHDRVPSQNTNRTITNLMIALSLLLALVLFIVLQPRIANVIIPGKAARQLNNFARESTASGSIDPWNFWQMRDQLDFGALTLVTSDPQASEAADITTQIALVSDSYSFRPWHIFRSNKILSVEGPMSVDTNSSLSDMLQLPSGRIIFANSTDLIIQSDDSRSIYIIFVRPIDTMATVNGYLHFANRNQAVKNDLANQQWLTISTFVL